MNTFTGKIRRVFITGLLVSLPLAITVFVFKFILDTLDNFLGPLATKGLLKVGAPIPVDFQIPGIGVVATIILVFTIGLITKNYLGRKLWGLGEMIVDWIPGIRSVYNGAKQIIDTFARSNTKAFSKVVMLEYPRKGIWCLAFITGKTEGEAQVKTDRELINIFLPTTPNPTSGFLLLVPKEDLIELSMTVEEGVKMIVSGGIVTPEYIPESAAKEESAFVNEVIDNRASDELIKKLAAGHKGVIKVVVDIHKEIISAGAEWHNQLLDHLTGSGSDEKDCWGAKLDIKTGELKFKSQINENRPGVTGAELIDDAVRKPVEKTIRKLLR